MCIVKKATKYSNNKTGADKYDDQQYRSSSQQNTQKEGDMASTACILCSSRC